MSNIKTSLTYRPTVILSLKKPCVVCLLFSIIWSGRMKWVKRGLQYFCVVVLSLEQQNKPKQTPVCMGSMSNVDGDVKQPYRRPSVCVWQWLVGWGPSLFCLSLSQILLFYCDDDDDDDDFGICCCCCDNGDDANDADDDCGACVCISVFCLILRFLFLSWRLDFSHTEAIRPTGKLRYFTERERIHVVRDFQFQLRFLPIYDNTLWLQPIFIGLKCEKNSYSQRKCQLIFAFYLPRITDCFCQCVWVCVRVWAEKKTSPKRKL